MAINDLVSKSLYIAKANLYCFNLFFGIRSIQCPVFPLRLLENLDF